MQHDRLITITSAGNRWSKNWQPQQMLLSELWERLRTPVRSSEKLSDYLSMKKAQQDELKDVGGYVGGTLNSPRRKSANVTGRDIITLDFDNISANGTENVLQRIAGLGVGYCVYSTRKHHAGAPRLRVLIPLDRTVSVEEYEPCARKMAEYIGLEMADPSTFEVARLMYWPSCCSDSQYVYHWADSPFVSADGLLALYEDWQDMSKWPALPGTQTFTKLATKQGDPVDKAGIVGAFCRVYDVERAMLELLVGIYEPVDTMPGRYTYLGGSTAGGAVLYDDGKFLFSHHATDPCGGKLVNAFDLVRLHKFSDLDDSDGVKDGTKGNRLPSFTAMCQYAVSLSEVSNQMAADDFADLSSVDDSYSEPHNTDWTKHLTRDDTGALHKTIANITLLVQNIPELNGCARKDDFTGRFYTADNLPWRTEKGYWSDSDTTELRRYFETKLKRYKPGKQDIKDAVVAVAINQSFHPVQNYLNSLSWDGVERLDTLFMDYLGAADSEYGRAVARKALCGAVARVMTPGCKFDYMPLLIGGQGRGKSSLIAKLAGITDWFTDSIVSFDGNKAFEAVAGKWLVEVPEMQAFDRATMNQAKAFITKQSDFYRAAYAEFPEDRPRQCVFFGTTNDRDCLRDETGGRRFWPIVADEQLRKKDIFIDLPIERDQIWAEAFVRWQEGEPLYLPHSIEVLAAERQENHRETHPWEDTIRNFVSKDIPVDWDSWDLPRRNTFWGGQMSDELILVPREKVCVREVWQEALNMPIAQLDKVKARTINSVLSNLEGWEASKKAMRFGTIYGVQKGYRRTGRYTENTEKTEVVCDTKFPIE